MTPHDAPGGEVDNYSQLMPLCVPCMTAPALAEIPGRRYCLVCQVIFLLRTAHPPSLPFHGPIMGKQHGPWGTALDTISHAKQYPAWSPWG